MARQNKPEGRRSLTVVYEVCLPAHARALTTPPSQVDWESFFRYDVGIDEASYNLVGILAKRCVATFASVKYLKSYSRDFWTMGCNCPAAYVDRIFAAIDKDLKRGFPVIPSFTGSTVALLSDDPIGVNNNRV